MSNWTMAKEGEKRVEIVGKDDKRQITAVFAGSMSGDFLPPQVIYQGKIKRCIPSIEFPPDWDITFSENHWSYNDTEKILPYINGKRFELKLNSNHPALVLFDRFKGQCSEKIFHLLGTNNIVDTVVPALCTDRL